MIRLEKKLLSIVLFSLILVNVGCIKCPNYYSYYNPNENECKEFERFLGYVQSEQPSGNLYFNVSLDFCNTYNRECCFDKKILIDSISLKLMINNEELVFNKKKGSYYEYLPSKNDFFDMEDSMSICLNYAVDSANIILNRRICFKTIKEMNCYWSVH